MEFATPTYQLVLKKQRAEAERDPIRLYQISQGAYPRLSQEIKGAIIREVVTGEQEPLDGESRSHRE